MIHKWHFVLLLFATVGCAGCPTPLNEKMVELDLTASSYTNTSSSDPMVVGTVTLPDTLVARWPTFGDAELRVRYAYASVGAVVSSNGSVGTTFNLSIPGIQKSNFTYVDGNGQDWRVRCETIRHGEFPSELLTDALCRFSNTSTGAKEELEYYDGHGWLVTSDGMRLDITLDDSAHLIHHQDRLVSAVDHMYGTIYVVDGLDPQLARAASAAAATIYLMN